MKCLAIKLVQILFLVCSYQALPIDDDTFEIVSNDIDENSEDNFIDISSLGPEAYGVPKNESGDLLATWNETSLMNPEEMGEYAEGDILMPQLARNGIKGESQRWPSGHIPYLISGSFNKNDEDKLLDEDMEEKIVKAEMTHKRLKWKKSVLGRGEGKYDQNQRDTIMMAIADYHRLTCLRFVPYNGQQDYITIQSQNTGCWSSVGRIGGRQEVNLQIPGCITKKGTVLHELLHAIGFMHEQSRPERDNHVTVNYNNIKPGTENNFRKADAKSTDGYGVVYDYNSVMHYSEYAFSKNSRKTIEPKVSGVKLGQREGLSRGDVKKVNNMYGCKKEEPQSGWLGGVFQSFFGNKASEADNYYY